MFVLIREKSGTPVGIFRDVQNAHQFVRNFHKNCEQVVENRERYIQITMMMEVEDMDQWMNVGCYRLYECVVKD